MARSRSRSRSPRRDRIRDRDGRGRDREKDRSGRRDRDTDRDKDRRPRRDASPVRKRRSRTPGRRARSRSDSAPPRRRSVSVDLKKTREEKEQDRLEREAEERERAERERRERERRQGEEERRAGGEGPKGKKMERPQAEEEYDFQDVFENGGGDKVASFIEEVREQSAQEAEVERRLQEEAQMMALMGFPGGFDTTKGKYVVGANHSAVKVTTKRQARQFMNRKGGFNRPLPAEKNK